MEMMLTLVRFCKAQLVNPRHVERRLTFQKQKKNKTLRFMREKEQRGLKGERVRK